MSIDYNNMRIQVYYLDGGVYCKAYIQEVTLRELNALNRRKRHIGFILAADDPYGKRLPECIRPEAVKQQNIYLPK